VNEPAIGSDSGIMTLHKNVIHRAFELQRGVRLLSEAGLHLPALMLIYSGIDSMAWLGRDSGKDQGSRQDFIGWARAYLLPGSKLKCSAEDLYGARCAILHSMVAESSMSRGGGAKLVWYSWGDHSAENLQSSIDKMENTSAVAVHIPDLIQAVHHGFSRFFTAIEADPLLCATVNARAEEKYFKDFEHAPSSG
jgi:hypothetical protein